MKIVSLFGVHDKNFEALEIKIVLEKKEHVCCILTSST